MTNIGLINKINWKSNKKNNSLIIIDEVNGNYKLKN